MEVDRVEKLQGPSNWAQWYFITKTLLDSANALEVCEGTRPKPESTSENYENKLQEWNKANKYAKKLIVTTVEAKTLDLLMNCETANEMWQKLLGVYELKSDESLALIQKEFFDFKWNAQNSVAQHVSTLEQLASKMKKLGGEIPETMLLTRILTTLPAKFNHFHSAWDSTEEKKKNLANLTTRLLTEELRMESQQEEEGPVAMMSKLKLSQKNVKFQKKGVKNETRIKSGCFTCGKTDHIRKDCPGCYKCGSIFHLAKHCRKDNTVRDRAQLSSSKSNEQVERQAFVNYSRCSHSNDVWIIDSGASEHISNSLENIYGYSEFESAIPIQIGDGTAIYALGKGNIDVTMFADGKWLPGTIFDVLYVPKMTTNLFSVKKTAEKGIDFVVSDHGKQCMFMKNNEVVATGTQSNNLYRLIVRVIRKVDVNVAGKGADLQVWHERLGHQNKKHVQTFLQQHNIQATTNETTEDICDGCAFGKIHRKSFSSKSDRAVEPREMIHSDVCGPMSVESLGKRRYFLLLKDDFSSYRKLYFIREKSEVPKKIEMFFDEVKNCFNREIKQICTDGGREYMNADVKFILEKRGIKHTENIPYTPEQNGLAERENRTLMETARAMLYSKPDLPKFLWAEAVNAAAYVLNRTGPTKVSGKTPYELWYNKTTSVKHFKVFGTECFVHIPKEKRKKIEKKAYKGFMVGYLEDSYGYRVWVPELHDVIISRDVVFKQEQFPNKSVADGRDEKYSSPQEADGSDILIQTEHQACVEENTEDNPIERNMEVAHETESEEDTVELERERKQLRERSGLKKPDFYGSPVSYIAEAEDPDIPKTYEEAMSSDDRREWTRAIKEEIESIKKNQVWRLITRPKDKRILASRWIFKVKYKPDGTIDRFKARLVVKGYAQRAGTDYEDTYSPVVRYETVRTVLSVAAQEHLHFRQFDVKTAFLYGDLKDDIYMEQPSGFQDGTQKVCKLIKSLYGLKQAPRCWNAKFTQFLIDCKLKESCADPCLYVRNVKGRKLLILLYVDDGLVIASEEKDADDFLTQLRDNFEARVIENVTSFLGIEIRKESDGAILIGQTNYLKNLLLRYGMSDSNPVRTPIVQGSCDDSVEDTIIGSFPYRELVGSLMYLQVISRPDIAFAVNMAARFVNCPTSQHVQLVKRILRYLKGSVNLSLRFGGNTALQTYSDADFAGDIESTKSTTGVLCKFAGGAVLWESSNQQSVALSTTEAEYVSATSAAKDVVWLVRLLSQISACAIDECKDIFVDNQSALKLVKNPEFHKRTKHIDIKYHFIRDLHVNGQIELKHISSEQQLADIFTKALPRFRFEKLRSQLGMM